MATLDLIIKLWPFLGFLVVQAGVGTLWVIKLGFRVQHFEIHYAKVQQLEHLGAKVQHLELLLSEKIIEFRELELRHRALDSKVVSELGMIRESLARMEGHFGLKRRERV